MKYEYKIDQHKTKEFRLKIFKQHKVITTFYFNYLETLIDHIMKIENEFIKV